VPTVSLLPPDDQLFRALIVKFCADRQMAVDETVVSYLATRIERSFAAARRLSSSWIPKPCGSAAGYPGVAPNTAKCLIRGHPVP